jgi:N-acetylglucosamine-6-phosphate deacetylase
VTVRTLLSGAWLLDPEADGPMRGSLLIERGRIAARLLPEQPAPADALRVELPARCGLGPGLVDLHHHGDLVLRPARDAVDSLSAASASSVRHGVTAFLPTTVAWEAGELAERVTALAAALAEGGWPGAVPVGVHLEGPWIRAEAAGAQPRGAIRPFAADEGLDLLARGEGAIRMVTMAPEVPGSAALADQLGRRGVRIAIGHTLAERSEVARAVSQGARHVTHLFNAMGSTGHRDAPRAGSEPTGVPGAVLAEDLLSCDVIADGAHVHPAWLAHAVRVKKDRLVLITDRIEPPPGAAGAPGPVDFGSGPLESDGVAWRLPDGRLAASHLTLDDAVRNCDRWRVMTRLEALAACTLAPARLLGIESERGTLRPGARADLVLWAPDGQARATWVAGRLVHGEPVESAAPGES